MKKHQVSGVLNIMQHYIKIQRHFRVEADLGEVVTGDLFNARRDPGLHDRD